MIIGYPFLEKRQKNFGCWASLQIFCRSLLLHRWTMFFIFVYQDGRLIGKNPSSFCSQYLLHSNCHKIWNIPWFFRTKLFLSPRLLRKNPIESHNMPTNWLVSPQWVGPKLGISPHCWVFSSKSSSLERKCLQTSDARVSKTSEILGGIRALRQMGWEDIFDARVRKLRDEATGRENSGQWQGWLP